MDGYWKEVIQVSTRKHDIKVLYLYDKKFNFVTLSLSSAWMGLYEEKQGGYIHVILLFLKLDHKKRCKEQVTFFALVVPVSTIFCSFSHFFTLET